MILLTTLLLVSPAGAVQLKPACELQLVAVPASRRQDFVALPVLPYLRGRLTIERLVLEDKSVAYALVTRGGDTVNFSLSGLFDFWLNELIYRYELNPGLKVRTVLYGKIYPNLPRRIPLVTVDPKFISVADAEKFLRNFLVSVADLNLVTPDWKRELNFFDLIKYLRGFPETENYLDRELLFLWSRGFPKLYDDLSVQERLLLGGRFFNPQRALLPDEQMVRTYIFQGNKREELTAIERLHQKIATLFPSIIPMVIDENHPAPPRSGGVEASVDTSLRLAGGTRLSDARNIQFDPHVEVADLDLPDELHAKLKSAQIVIPDQLMFYDAQKLARELNLSRAEFLALAQSLFNENIFLKINWLWDLNGWRVLKDHTYLRTPRRITPKTKRELIPVSRDEQFD